MDKPPDFTLKAKDALAPRAVAAWISDALKLNVADVAFVAEQQIPPEKIARAADHLAAMIRWQAKHGCKLPD